MMANEDEGQRRGRRGDTTNGGDVQREYVGAGFIGGVVLLIVVGIVLVALIAQNSDTVPFRLLWLEADIALAALLLGSAVLAVLMAELVGTIWRRRRRAYRSLRESKAG